MYPKVAPRAHRGTSALCVMAGGTRRVAAPWPMSCGELGGSPLRTRGGGGHESRREGYDGALAFANRRCSGP